MGLPAFSLQTKPAGWGPLAVPVADAALAQMRGAVVGLFFCLGRIGDWIREAVLSNNKPSKYHLTSIKENSQYLIDFVQFCKNFVKNRQKRSQIDFNGV